MAGHNRKEVRWRVVLKEEPLSERKMLSGPENQYNAALENIHNSKNNDNNCNNKCNCFKEQVTAGTSQQTKKIKLLF